MKLRIEEDLCTGHGRCYALAPELFDTDDFGHGTVTVDDVPDRLLERARLAVGNCPEGAITLGP